MTTTTKFVKELYNEDLVYSSVVFGMGFWIDDQGLFISAPEFKDGSLDVDNAIPVYDWESFDELTPHHLSHLMHVNQMCILKRDSQQIEYYSEVLRSLCKISNKRNGICIELTPTQYDYLYEVIMFAYEMEVPEQKGWDIQTYDNMVDNVTNGKSTILSNDVKGIMPLN